MKKLLIADMLKSIAMKLPHIDIGGAVARQLNKRSHHIS